jgi:hypothetical protein
MCKPVWFNVKRANMLSLVGRLPGAVVADPSFFSMKDKLTILDKIQEESGYLFIVSYRVLPGTVHDRTVVAALWYPNFGGAGWVDLPKDPKTHALVKQWETLIFLREKTSRMEAEANNCMAL